MRARGTDTRRSSARQEPVLTCGDPSVEGGTQACTQTRSITTTRWMRKRRRFAISWLGRSTWLYPHAENKIWHAHPVWFLDGNPVVGYSKQKVGVVLLFWSGQSFGRGGPESGRQLQGRRSPLHCGQPGGHAEPSALARQGARHSVDDYRDIGPPDKPGQLARLK